MKYLTPYVIQDGNRTIPCDPANADYQEILRRIRDEGLVVEPYVPPPPSTPEEVRKVRYRTELTDDALEVILLQADGLSTVAKFAAIKAKKKLIDDAIPIQIEP